MYDYIEGIVTNIYSGSISVNVGGIGFLVNTPSPYSFNEGEKTKVYLYQVVREDELSLYGFKEEKEMFLKLISVKGLGPKMTLPLLATGSIDGIMDAIERENILYLKKFPKIGDKVAKQIILDLKGKLGDFKGEEETSEDNSSDLYDALVSLGYKDKEIKGVVGKVDKNLSIGDQIKDALKMLLK